MPILCVWLLGFTSVLQAAASSDAPQALELRGTRVMVQAELSHGALHEHYFARQGDSWVEVAATAETALVGPVSLVSAPPTSLPATAQKVLVSNGSLVEEFNVGPHRVIRTLWLMGDSPWLRVTTRMEPSGKLSLSQFSDRLRFLRRPDWSFSPSVGGFNPDAQYKAPLILVQTSNVAFGIVPAVNTLGREELKRCNHALDLDVPGGPTLGVGFMPARLASHSVYALDTNRVWTTETAVENTYFLLVTASAEPGQAYRQAVRFHWEQFGRGEQAYAADQQVGTDPRYRSLALWDEWREMVWKKESPQSWLQVPLPDGSLGGGARTRRWGPGPSVYLSSWFNTLRTSYGMALYARRTGQDDLLKLAGQTLELALKAPGHEGAFKCIAVPGANGSPTLWAAGDGSGGSTKEGFLGYDMCWTAYWMLKWRAAGLPGSEGVLPRSRKLAQFMMARQLANGMLPTRFAEDGSVQEERSKAVKAETGPVVLFLLELYNQDRDPLFLEAAQKGFGFLEKEVIPQRQWYDYETFWSCSPRKENFDERTQQWPANNLALAQTVAAYLLAHRITGQASYLAQGETLLDYLLLYQQCWTNPRLESLSSKAMLLGGFTTQNSDAEWSDARQSQCGNILLDYYRATNKIEYLERGAAALRAQFPISPSENWAHVGYGAKAGVSSFHWGTGSGMAGIELEEDYLRDGIVDVAAGRGIGVNGLNLTECTIDGGRIQLSISSPFKWPQPPVIVFRRADPSRSYEVFVNATKAGSWRGKELEKGISLPLASEQSTPSKAVELPADLTRWFTPPEKYRADFGGFRSPLVFDDGTPVRTAADWQRRRTEILASWHKLMGPWPALIEKPRVEVVNTSRRQNITQHELRMEVALGGEMIEGLLLVPEDEGAAHGQGVVGHPVHQRPAVLVVYYDAETGVGLGAPLRDYAWQLARRGFVTLSIGKPNAHIDLSTTNKPRTEPYLGPVGQPVRVQPLSALAYAAANAHTVLAQRPDVDPARIGIVGHSFGGKWAMFASCLYDKFACAVWSDPGIVFDERDRRKENPSGSVNYYDVWYLGCEPGAIADPKNAGTWRKLPSEGQARTGAYKELVEGAHDLVELHALMAPRPFLVSGGTADLPERWPALNHAIAVNKLLDCEHRVALTHREGHSPTDQANEQVYQFFQWWLQDRHAAP